MFCKRKRFGVGTVVLLRIQVLLHMMLWHLGWVFWTSEGM